MTGRLILLGILLAALLSACGQGTDEPTGLSAAQAEAQLTERLHLTPTATNLGEFTPVGGGTCAVLLTATGETADLYAEDAGTVWSPDGAVLVKVTPHIPLIGEASASPAACELTVETALAGGGKG